MYDTRFYSRLWQCHLLISNLGAVVPCISRVSSYNKSSSATTPHGFIFCLSPTNVQYVRWDLLYVSLCGIIATTVLRNDRLTFWAFSVQGSVSEMLAHCEQYSQRATHDHHFWMHHERYHLISATTDFCLWQLKLVQCIQGSVFYKTQPQRHWLMMSSTQNCVFFKL